MNILHDVHIYLLISFLLTGWAIFKFAYKKFDSSLAKNINDMKDLLSNLEKRKCETELHLEKLKNELKNVNESINKTIFETELEAKKITEKTNLEITQLVKKKQGEYDLTVEKIKSGLSVELQNKLTEAVIRELVKKLQKTKETREFQNTSIENSMDMIESLVNKYFD